MKLRKWLKRKQLSIKRARLRSYRYRLNQKVKALHINHMVADNLRQAALNSGITHCKLAAKIGIYRTTLSRLMSGHYEPSISFIERAAKALNLPECTLLSPRATTISDLSTDAFSLQLFKITPPNQRHNVIDVLWQISQPDWNQKLARLNQYPFNQKVSKVI